MITYISSYIMPQQFSFINKSFLAEGEFISAMTKTYTIFFRYLITVELKLPGFFM